MMFKEIVDHVYSSFQDTNCAMLDAEEEEVVSVPQIIFRNRKSAASIRDGRRRPILPSLKYCTIFGCSNSEIFDRLLSLCVQLGS
jgi:hypothetical protein